MFCIRLASNPEIANQVSAEVVTKREALTIAEIFSYMTQESAKVKIKLNISSSFRNALIFISNFIHGCRMPFLSARLRLMMLCMALLGTILDAVSAMLRLPKAQLH